MVIKRALIIKKEHLDKIFDSGKIWEMRSGMTHITERIGLIESGSGLIMGEVDLDGTGYPIQSKVDAALNCDKHQVDNLDLLKKWKWPWLLANPNRYPSPVPYNHPKGAVIWVKL